MKHITRILVLAVILFTGLTTVSAQIVQVEMRQKVAVLPPTGTNYLDDPFRYFDVRFIVAGAGAEGLDIFFDMDFTVNASSFYFRTKKDKKPKEPIHLHEGENIMKREQLQTQFKNRLETNVFNNPLAALQLPEGEYELCVDVYLWSDLNNPNRVPISLNPCHDFEICYSGSAPELVSPLAGAQMALNGAMVVKPTRRVSFFWTPVISNCAGRNTRFKYKLKVVKVLYGQNYNDAIKYNPTVFSAEVRNNNFAVLDTLRDIKVRMERGALYVAQLQAEEIMTSARSTFIIANDGFSQPMPFFWDFPDSDYLVNVEDEEGEEVELVDGLTVWEGGVEETSELDEILEEVFPDERVFVFDPKRHYVESNGYINVPMTDDLEVGYMPAQHESLSDVSYEIQLYDYVVGGVDSIIAHEPLLSETIGLTESDSDTDSRELVSHTLDGWGANLKQGKLYYLLMSCSYTAKYWKYAIADTSFYVNEMLAEHVYDTVLNDHLEERLENTEGLYFQWGSNPKMPAFTAPQWIAPVDRTGDDVYDPVNYELPSYVPQVQKAGTFPVSWAPLQNVTPGDAVEYEVNVYELLPDQTLEEAITENEVLVTRTITDANAITDDDQFFKVFSSQKTYVMTLSTVVDGESTTIYHFENGNEALPIVFKIVK